MKNSYYPLKINWKHRIYVWRIIGTLNQLPRTGYKDRGVNNPETVGQHIDETVAIAEKHFPHIPGLTTMLKIHDWPESNKNIGDPRTDKLCPPKKRWTKANKYAAELAVMKNIASDMGPTGEELLALWLEYEGRKTERAKLAFQIDKFQMIRKACFYQKTGEPVVAQEFIDSSSRYIKNPILKQLMNEAIATIN
jgi:5'-deoxynucleotidase YfbR-like HD superfamily hydrolase